MPLLIGQLERDRKQGGRERGTDMQQRPSDAGLKPGPTAVRTVASVHGAPAQPTSPPTTQSYFGGFKKKDGSEGMDILMV